jgi:hypothetical protein
MRRSMKLSRAAEQPKGRRCEAEKRLVGGLRAGRRRKRPTASPEQLDLLRLRARGNDAGRAACNGSNQRAAEVEGRPRQEAANCVAQTARPSQAPGEGQ